jgi:NAD(P)-dependent dehydrogenase (short-subunit alcohol dehydrogenase family)
MEATEVAGRLAGKVCVITGTGGSMGRAAALAFAREGASVVGCDVTVEPAVATVEMVHAAGGAMVSLQPCHLGDPAECARLVELAVSEFGRIDVLYNLAARSQLQEPPGDIPHDEQGSDHRNDAPARNGGRRA